MKTYKVKSSAVRAAKKDFGDCWKEQGTLVQNDLKEWSFELTKNNDQIEEEKKKAIRKMEKETKKDGPKKKKVYANSSSVGSPCSLVWFITEEMGLEAKRKDVLAECEKQGVTFYTARTQYQKYKEALRGDVK